MSHLVNNLLSRSGLFKTFVAGVALAASVTVHAVVADASVAPSVAPSAVADSAAQVQAFDTVAELGATPLNASEVETFDGARFKWRQWFFPKPNPKPLPLPLPKPPTCKPGPIYHAAMICK